MIFKSYNLEQKLEDIDNYKLFLFYGENHGLKKDFKKNLKIKHKNKEIINLYQDEITKNENILINEIKNKSLFNEKKVIFIDQASDKILDIITKIDENLQNEIIFLFADILDKKSKLRNYFEKSKIYGVSACYQDNEITIRKIITKRLNGYQGLTNQTINLIIQSTGLNRDKVNNEIDKIISCFDSKIIDQNKIELLLNITTNDNFNLLKDEALKGDKIKTNKLLADTVFQAENYIYYLNLINQRMNKLNEINDLKQNTSNIEEIISNIKPPIFWKDKPILVEQSKKWDKQKIQNALNRTYDAEIKIKSGTYMRQDLIIKNLLVELCSEASVF